MTTTPPSPSTMPAQKTAVSLSDEMDLAALMQPVSDEYFDPEKYIDDDPGFVRPEIFLIHATHTLTLSQVQKALVRFNRINGPHIFRNTGRLVWVVKDERGNVQAVPLDRGKLRIILSIPGSTWKRWDKDETLEPPEKLLDTVLTAPMEYFPKVPPLTGIHTGVLLGADGNPVSRAGYDAGTGMYLTKSYDLAPVPEHPTAADVAEARTLLYAVFRDFLFADSSGEDSVNYQNTLAALVTAVLRPLWDGPVPIWVVDKNSQRTGGSLLQTVVGTAAFGVQQAAMPATRRKDEIDKIVRTIIAEDRVYGMIDNVEAGTNWTPEVLLSATTGTGMTATRDMGTYAFLARTSRTFFVVNGINIDVRADVAGRVFVTRLVAPKAWQLLSWSRTKRELEELVLRLHPEIVRAVAVLLRFWRDSGKPAPPRVSGNISEYAEWFRVVGGMLAAAGYTRVLANLVEIQTVGNDAEFEGAEVLDRLYAWHELRPFTAGELAARLVAEGVRWRAGEVSMDQDLLGTVPDAVLSAAVSGRLNARMTAEWLKQLLDRRFSGASVRLSKSAGRTKRGWMYLLEPVEVQDTIG
ncbi:MAG: hypothetical protein MJ014_03780 [Methanocorpusculum sp.]|nr:hypothetical protein [Methanocorpusculum sp.]